MMWCQIKLSRVEQPRRGVRDPSAGRGSDAAEGYQRSISCDPARTTSSAARSRRPLTSAWQMLVIKACMERPDTPLNDIFIKPLFSRAFLQPAKRYHFQKFSEQFFYSHLSLNFSCYKILFFQQLNQRKRPAYLHNQKPHDGHQTALWAPSSRSCWSVRQRSEASRPLGYGLVPSRQNCPLSGGHWASPLHFKKLKGALSLPPTHPPASSDPVLLSLLIYYILFIPSSPPNLLNVPLPQTH